MYTLFVWIFLSQFSKDFNFFCCIKMDCGDVDICIYQLFRFQCETPFDRWPASLQGKYNIRSWQSPCKCHHVCLFTSPFRLTRIGHWRMVTVVRVVKWLILLRSHLFKVIILIKKHFAADVLRQLEFFLLTYIRITFTSPTCVQVYFDTHSHTTIIYNLCY